MQFYVNSVSKAFFRMSLATSITALASCGGSKSGTDNATQYDDMDYALAAEYSNLPAAVIIRVPLDASGAELAAAASMRAYHGNDAVAAETDLAGIFADGRSPGQMISSLSDLNDEETSTQSWGHWNNQAPYQGKVAQSPYQAPYQGKVAQSPYQAPYQGKVAQSPYQAPYQGKVAQSPYQAPYQGKIAQSPMQGPRQGPRQGPAQKCCLAKHDKSKAFFNLFQSRKQRCGPLGPLLHKRRCMAVPALQIPVYNGPVVGGAPVVIDQQIVIEQPDIVAPGPVVLPSYNNTQFVNFQPRAYSNVNDNGYWGYDSAISATYGQTRFYAYARPACEGAEWCELVNN